MKASLLAVLAAVLFILQISFVPALRPFGVVPNVVLALVALVGLYGTSSLALILAVTGGLTLDLVSGADFGLYVGLFSVVALTAGYIHRAGLNWVGPTMVIGLVTVATMVQDVMILGGLVRVAGSWPIGHLAMSLILEILLNSFVATSLRPLVRWLLPASTGELEIRT